MKMDLKIMQLTKKQRTKLRDMQAEIMRMFVANPHEPGAILAQVIPPAGEMRIRVLDHTLVSQLAKILPAEWGNESGSHSASPPTEPSNSVAELE